MGILSTFHRGEYRRRQLTFFFVLVIGAFAAYELAQYVIDDDMAGLAYAGLCTAGIAIVVRILNNWRNGLYFFLTWLLFEDCVRKFLGNNMAIYFAKDFLLSVVLISFITAIRSKRVIPFRPPLFGAAADFHLVRSYPGIQSSFHSNCLRADGL